jgi:hypothetical protein
MRGFKKQLISSTLVYNWTWPCFYRYNTFFIVQLASDRSSWLKYKRASIKVFGSVNHRELATIIWLLWMFAPVDWILFHLDSFITYRSINRLLYSINVCGSLRISSHLRLDGSLILMVFRHVNHFIYQTLADPHIIQSDRHFRFYLS